MENQIEFEEPQVKILQNGNLKLTADWHVRYGIWWFVVPAGFISDGNSVPPEFRFIVPQFGRSTLSGIIHDWLYRSGKVFVVNNGQSIVMDITRRQADIVRADIGSWCGVGRWERTAGFVGLRIGGRRTWNQYTAIRKKHHDIDIVRLLGLSKEK